MARREASHAATAAAAHLQHRFSVAAFHFADRCFVLVDTLVSHWRFCFAAAAQLQTAKQALLALHWFEATSFASLLGTGRWTALE